MMNQSPGTALITGASSGIGAEIARKLAQRGHDLVLVARRKNALDQLARSLMQTFDINARVYPCDLTSAPDRAALVDSLQNEDIEILINSAGIGSTGSFSDLKIDSELNQINLNVLALVDLCHAFVAPMIKEGRGQILNVASTAAFQPGPYMAVYYASKAFVNSFSQALAYEVDNSGVKVISLCPGPTETEFGNVSGNENNHLFAQPGASAQSVAEAAMQALDAGKPLKIVGLKNRINAYLVRFLPGRFVKQTTAHLNSPFREPV